MYNYNLSRAGGSVWSVYAAFDARGDSSSSAVHACMREGSICRWNVALPRRCLCDDGFRCGFHRKMRVYLTIKDFYRWKGFSATGKPFAYMKNPFAVLVKPFRLITLGFLTRHQLLMYRNRRSTNCVCSGNKCCYIAYVFVRQIYSQRVLWGLPSRVRQHSALSAVSWRFDLRDAANTQQLRRQNFCSRWTSPVELSSSPAA